MATIPIPFQIKSGHPRRKVDAKKVIMLRAQGLSGRAIGKKLGGWHGNGASGRSGAFQNCFIITLGAFHSFLLDRS
jgi:hypothetical protein